MKTTLAVMVVAMGLGAAACPPRPGPVAVQNVKCQIVVLQDTVRLYAMEHTVMMSTKSDTVPKPHATCLTVYAIASDTVPKP